ncbi:DUF4255 domain-containing protein [Botryobacter ruber]|uniref:DUF4255 domain-containing protein n=1 Tax=Botryobacter ruber TaxID=2171629 RepID=UPI000E0C445F|nr:DUF4255 domain-containing protein [Botryobacter ruber]
MISEALGTIITLLNNYISPGFSDPPLVLANISKVNDGDEFTQSMQDKLVMSIVNIEEDRVAKSPENFIRENNLVKYKSPPIHLNLTVLFAATHDYDKALPLLEKIIRFFQIKRAFTPANTPELATANEVNDSSIEKIVFEWVNLNLEQVHQLWTTLGGHYMPSVVFKIRMLTMDEHVIQKEAHPVKDIIANYDHI